MKILHLVCAVALALILNADVSFSEIKKIRIGTEGAYPPFNSYDADRNLVGFDIDIAKALCAQMNVECEFVAQDWDGIIPSLLAKKYDAIVASMSITEERLKKVDFTEKYQEIPSRFMAVKGSGIQAVDPESLKDKILGAQSSTTHATYLEDIYVGSQIKLYQTLDDANLDLAAGRIDLVLAASVPLMEWAKTKAGACCEFVGDNIKSVKYFGKGAGIAVRKEDGQLKEMFNKALSEILANGTYKKINDKYFSFSIY
jgi:lysine-arginine-ornithine-binding protein